MGEVFKIRFSDRGSTPLISIGGFLDLIIGKAHVCGLYYLKLVGVEDLNMNDSVNDTPLKKYFIAYFDVLGYEDYVYSDNNSAIHLAQTLRKSIEFINARNKKAEQLDKEYAYKFRCFSDNFLLCSKYDQDLIESIAWLQFNLALDNIFVRGSFSFGELHFDKDFVFGKGIINAHKIESKVAIFPRIVVDNTYTAATSTSLSDNDDTLERGTVPVEYIGQIKSDFDGINFIDYLDCAKLKSDIGHWKFENGFCVELENHKKNIVRNIEKYSQGYNPTVLQKYKWLRNYHNNFCSEQGYSDIIVP